MASRVKDLELVPTAPTQREADLEGLLQEPLLDILLRKQGEGKKIGGLGDGFEEVAVNIVMQQQERIQHLEAQLDEALKGRLLVPLWNVERDLCRMSTRVSLDLPYCEFDECQDRAEFRRKLSREMTKMGDALMAAWEQLHGEQS